MIRSKFFDDGFMNHSDANLQILIIKLILIATLD